MVLWSKIVRRLSANVERWPSSLQRLHLWVFQKWLGTRVHDHGRGNSFILERGATSGLRLTFFGHDNKVTVHRSVCISNLEIHVVASGLSLEIHEGVQIANGYFWLGGDNARVVIGTNAYLINNTINLTDSNARLDIGPGCMLGAGAQIRLGDGHTLYNARDGTILNKGHHVVLEAHVWLAQDALILKDVVIGAGSVIGARAVVTRDVPAGCVAAGIPANVVRRDIKWHREKNDNLPEGWYKPDVAAP